MAFLEEFPLRLVVRTRSPEANWQARIFPQRYGKGPSHRKDSNLRAEKGKGCSKQKRRKAHHIGQQHQQLKKLTAEFKQKMGEPKKERSPFYMKDEDLALKPP
nr:hypothetical protein [Tanacetum cinerariifolium]